MEFVSKFDLGDETDHGRVIGVLFLETDSGAVATLCRVRGQDGGTQTYAEIELMPECDHELVSRECAEALRYGRPVPIYTFCPECGATLLSRTCGCSRATWRKTCSICSSASTPTTLARDWIEDYVDDLDRLLDRGLKGGAE